MHPASRTLNYNTPPCYSYHSLRHFMPHWVLSSTHTTLLIPSTTTPYRPHTTYIKLYSITSYLQIPYTTSTLDITNIHAYCSHHTTTLLHSTPCTTQQLPLPPSQYTWLKAIRVLLTRTILTPLTTTSGKNRYNTSCNVRSGYHRAPTCATVFVDRL